MANTAEVINFPVPDVAPKEPRVADLDDGYTRLANELLDAVMCSGLPETELCILMAVWRKTYGYNKKMDWISNEQPTTFTYTPATAPGGAATTQGTIGAVTLSDITLPVKVLAVETGNSKTVTYDRSTGFLTWNNNDSCALVLL